MMARRSGVRGGARLRRFLAAMPAAVETEIMDVLDEGSAPILAEMKARAPKRTGATIAALDRKLYPKTLRVRIGLIGRNVPFWAKIQDLGRKAKTVPVTRRAGSSGFYSKTAMRRALVKGGYREALVKYQLRVRAMAGKRFVTGRFTDLRRDITRRLGSVWTRALRRLGGAG